MFAIVFLLLFSLVAQPMPAIQAQDAEPIWYFAQRESTLIAFTADGQQNEIMSSFGDVQAGWRWDAETVLLLTADTSGVHHLYRITSEKAAEIRLPIPEDADMDDIQLMPVDWFGNYVLFRAATSPYTPSLGFLVNVSSTSAERLTGLIAQESRIDDNGTLRYISYEHDGIWSLLERQLGNDEERSLYTLTREQGFPPFFTVNHSADAWTMMYREDNNSIVNRLIRADGTTEDLEISSNNNPTLWRFFDDLLVGNPPWCEEDCHIIVRDGEQDTEFTLPRADTSFTVLARPNEETLLVLGAGNEVVLLNQSEKSKSVGTYVNAVQLNLPNDIVSPTQDYVFTASYPGDESSEQEIYVTNLNSLEQVFQSEVSTNAHIFWLERGFIASVFDSDTTKTLYLNSTENSIELPYASRGNYFELLPDNSLLYSLIRGEPAVGAPGIYRYDPISETFILLVENARALYAQPLEFAS